MKSKKSRSWSGVKDKLAKMDRASLVGVIKNLYEASSQNRRFLHARFAPSGAALEEYRELVSEAVYPDLLSQRPVRLRDAAAAITEYKRATGELVGVLDLVLTFVEAGTQLAADTGHGDDSYFATLERKLNEALSILEDVPEGVRDAAVTRMIRLGEYQNKIGWGYGDFLGGVANHLEKNTTIPG